MALENLRNLYQQVVLEQYKQPRNRGTTDPIHCQQRGHNPSCGDTIELTAPLDKSQNQMAAAKFEGEGCAIAIPSADLMADALAGQTITEALHMVQAFENMMKGEGEFPQEHRKLNTMQGVAQFPVRIKCTTLTWHTLTAALEHQTIESAEDFVSNEEID